MDCLGRFKAIDSEGLPAVVNYDYPENIPIRGINNRTFRWEEVSSTAPYHFLQTGVFNSILEPPQDKGQLTELLGPTTNTFVAPQYGIDNLISGWALSGWGIWKVGPTGYELPTSISTAYSSAFFEGGNGVGGDGSAYSGWGIAPNTFVSSIRDDGLYIYEFWTGAPLAQSAPGVFPNLKTAVSQSGILLLTGQRYQFYMEAKGVNLTVNTGLVGINYSPSYGVRPIIIGHNSSNVPICYWDARSGFWGTTMPTGIIFALEPGNVTEIAFDFHTINSLFPAGIPTQYTVQIEPPGPGVGIIIDSIYTDMYLARNPFSEVYVPTGYILQVTPDLGWHDTVAMFGDRESIINPHLKTLGPYLVSQNTLQDNRDGTVSVTLTSGDFLNNLNSSYSKYLWRAIPMNDYLQYGTPGFPKRFFYIGGNLESKFYIDQVFDDPISLVKVIIGKKSDRMKLETDIDTATIEYLSSDTWKCTVILTSPTLRLGLRGVDRGGATTKWHYVDLSTQGLPQVEKALWNVFDEHGLLADIKRLPGESNTDYKDRIKDILRSPAGSSYRGVVNGGCRELGLEKIEDAISIQMSKRSVGSYDAPSVSIEATTTCVKLRSPSMIRTEFKLLDPVSLTCQLDKLPASEPFLVESEDSIRVAEDKISIDTEDGEDPESQTVHIDDQNLGGRVVKISYEYYEVCYYSECPELCHIVDHLNFEAVNEGGHPMVEAVLNYKLAGGEDSRGLFVSAYNLKPGNTISLGWSPLILRRISDRAFRESFRSGEQPHWQTKFVEYTNELKSKTNIEWGSVVSDKDFWDAADNHQLSFDHLPTLMDPELTRFRTSPVFSGDYETMDSSEAQWRGSLGNSGEIMTNGGFSETDFHPGVGFTEDLRPDIFVGRKVRAPVQDGFEVIGDKVPNNYIQLFSGVF